MEQLAAAVGVHGGEEQAASRPLFPTSSGAACSKRGWVAAIRRLVEPCESPAERAARGDRLFKGHSARRGGAQFLARRWPLFVVQIFGRWGSGAIMGYVEEAALEGPSARGPSSAPERWTDERARRELSRGGPTAHLSAALRRLSKRGKSEILAALRDLPAAEGDDSSSSASA